MRSSTILASVAALLLSGVTAHGGGEYNTDIGYDHDDYSHGDHDEGYNGGYEDEEGDYPVEDEPAYPEPSESDIYDVPTITASLPPIETPVETPSDIPTPSDIELPTPTNVLPPIETGDEDDDYCDDEPEYPGAEKPTPTPGPCVSGVVGWDDHNPLAYHVDESGDYATEGACRELCAQEECVSFAFGADKCLLYAAPVTGNFVEDSESPITFHDYDCIPGTYPTPSETDSYPSPSETESYPETSDVYPSPSETLEPSGSYPSPSETLEPSGSYPSPSETESYPEPSDSYPEPSATEVYPIPGDSTITPAPSHPAGTTPPPSVTVIETTVSYVYICPTGIATSTITYTITSTICNTCAHPTPAPEGPGSNNPGSGNPGTPGTPNTPGQEIPPGFIVTTTVCTVCGPSTTTLTLTIPGPTITEHVSTPSAAPPAGGKPPAGGNPPAGEQPVPSGAVPSVPVNSKPQQTQIQTVIVTPIPAVPTKTHNVISSPTPTPPIFTGAATRNAVGGLAFVAVGFAAFL